MKKTAFLTALLLLMVAFNINAQIATPPAIGDGTSDNPYQIATLDNLYWLSQNSIEWSSHYIQTSNIDATTTNAWDFGDHDDNIGTADQIRGFLPIGNYEIRFSGTYNGKGHTIEGLFINRPYSNSAALFGNAYLANIDSLGLIDVNIMGSFHVGGLVGLLYENSTISNSFVTGSVSGTYCVGGLVGKNYLSSINNSYSLGSVTGTSNYVGGLVGENYYSSIINCYSSGPVTGTSNHLGGLVGRDSQSSSESLQIINSFWNLETSGQAISDGGIGISSSEMQQICVFLYKDWDFLSESENGDENIWGMNTTANGGFPFLSWQGLSHTADDSGCCPSLQGAGIISDPYQISSLCDLYRLSLQEELWDKHFVQTVDIDATSTITWNIANHDNDEETPNEAIGFLPIGNELTKFTGSYNGKGHTIEGLFINRPSSDKIGLFGYAYLANIDSLGLVDAQVTGYDEVGGLVGHSENSSITYSYCMGNISGTFKVGGLAGSNNNNSSINCSYSTGSAAGQEKIGGLVGYNYQTALISNSYSNSSVNGIRGGGLVGSNNSSSTINNCYSTGEVSGAYSVGGFVGYNGYSTIDNCYCLGYVTSTNPNNEGGFVGSRNNSIISNSFWNIETGGQAVSDAVIGIVDYDMKQSCVYLYAGWDFISETENGSENIWGLNANENGGYPFLYWQAYNNTEDDSECCPALLGSGTNQDPFQINTLCDLSRLSLSENLWDKNFIQTADIDASNTHIWSIAGIDTLGFSPIGNEDNAFTGSYNGEGHVIDNLLINRPSLDFVALFGHTSNANIDSLGIINVDVTGHYYVGSIVGKNNATPINSSYSTGQISGIRYIGGLIGQNYGSSIINSYSQSSCFGATYSGGLTGSNENNSSISYSYSTGSVNGIESVGGLVGINDESSIAYSYSTGSVNGHSSVGGLVGSDEHSSISYSYSHASSNGNTKVGGLVGSISNGSLLEFTYSTGLVTGNEYVGGLVGKGYHITQSYFTVRNSLWDIESSGQTNSFGGEGYVSSEMQMICTYLHLGWDFLLETENGNENICGINPNDNGSYPFLSWQGYSPTGDDSECCPSLSGAGTIDDPYQISSECDLLKLSLLADLWDKHFVQTADINASSTVTWNLGNHDNDNLTPFSYMGFKPIGDYMKSFRGTYNGKGHSIDSLFINRPSVRSIAFFGEIIELNSEISAVVDSILLTNVNITGGDATAALVGVNNGSSITNSGVTGSVSGAFKTGGLVAYNHYEGSISDSYSKCSVSGDGRVGGLVGYNDVAEISNCYSSNIVSGDGRVGGLVGYNYNTEISNCYSSCTVSGNGSLGGLVGLNDFGELVINSFWDIETSGQTVSDGGTGLLTSDMKEYCGYLYANWDFLSEVVNGTENTWGLNANENGAYPFLAWQNLTHTADITECCLTFLGSGTIDDPYQIAALCDLDRLCSNVLLYDKHFVQTANINASATNTWNIGDHDNDEETPPEAMGFLPIGNDEIKFTGTYNGKGFIIDSLYINRPSASDIGFFGFVDETIIDSLGLTNVNINGGYAVGSLVGNNSFSTISNSFSTGSVVGISNVGGLVAINNESSVISNCYSSCLVAGNSSIGGLVGSNEESLIEYSYSTGIVSSGSNNLGGLVGYSTSATIINSYWDIETSGQIESAGGEGLMSIEMMGMCKYLHTGWDFATEVFNGQDETWSMNSTVNDAYPFLSWQGYSHTGDDSECCVEPLGLGSINDPFQITSLCDLKRLSMSPNLWDKHFVQSQNIDASETFTWNVGNHDEDIETNDEAMGFLPIGNITNGFTGSYNGKGHTIDSLIINRPSSDNIALFSYTNDASIDSLGLINVDIKGGSGVGAIVALNNSSIINNSYSNGSVMGTDIVGGLIGRNTYYSIIDNSYYTGTVSGSDLIGGLVGDNIYHSLINNSYSTGSVVGRNNVGGLAGENYNSSTISNSYSSCTVSAEKKVGGLIGSNVDHGNIESSFSLGSVSGIDDYTGGLIGYSSSMAIRNSGSSSLVSGNKYTGGLVGHNLGTDIDNSYSTGDVLGTLYVGGLVGNVLESTIENCYSSSMVTATDIVGGLVGDLNSNSFVKKCYSIGAVSGAGIAGGLIGQTTCSDFYDSFWDIETSGIAISDGGIGKTTLEMHDLCMYLDAEWDFDSEVDNGSEDFWGMNSNELSGYPFLSWQGFLHTEGCLSVFVNPLKNIKQVKISIYPNPNKGIVNLQFENLKNVSIKAINVNGQVVYHEENINESFYQFELNQAAGVYFIEIISEGIIQEFKLIKE